MKILFKYTTRSRRSNFLRGIDSIINNLSDKVNYHIFTTIDTDDDKMRPLPEIIGNHTYIAGVSKSKVDAINRDMDYINANYDWQILVNFSDDMTFIKKGFDNDIRDAVISNGGNLDYCYHFPDQYQGRNCMTMSIIGRTYYDRQGFIYDNRFKSLWCDVVEQEKAQILNKYIFIDKNIFVHLHPSLGLAKYDELATHTESWELRTQDYNTYLEVKKEYDKDNIFPIRSI